MDAFIFAPQCVKEVYALGGGWFMKSGDWLKRFGQREMLFYLCRRKV